MLIYKMSRGTQRWIECLDERDEVAACKEELREVGCGPEMHEGILILVDPDQYEELAGTIRHYELRPYYVIASANYIAIIRGTLSRLANRLRVKLRENGPYIK